jgi:hypothetical protein
MPCRHSIGVPYRHLQQGLPPSNLVDLKWSTINEVGRS